jgi:hypothetical protein
MKATKIENALPARTGLSRYLEIGLSNLIHYLTLSDMKLYNTNTRYYFFYFFGRMRLGVC